MSYFSKGFNSTARLQLLTTKMCKFTGYLIAKDLNLKMSYLFTFKKTKCFKFTDISVMTHSCHLC